MKRTGNRKGFWWRLADMTEMPKEVALGVSSIRILGTGEMCIEHYRRLLEYTETLLRVQTKETQIRLRGRDLAIAYYMKDDMKITGEIFSVEFCE